MTDTITATTAKLHSGEHLKRTEACAVMEALLSGSVPDSEIADFLVALRDKGEQAAELAGFAEVMRERAAELLTRAGLNLKSLHSAGPLLDTCGTGGDGLGTFNISTATALVACAAGVRVAKHGNRSISSRCGSADVLEALGVQIQLPLERIPQCLEAVGMVFLFAPHLHLAMKHVMNARRSLRTRTVFNLLGPLTNPLGASAQLVGVYDRARTEMMAEALAAVGTHRALVVAGADGMDEISTAGPTRVSESHRGAVVTREITPEDFGIARAPAGAVAGGDAGANARLLRQVLDGEPGAYRDAVLANASAALVVAGKASGFLGGAALAAEVIDSGSGRRKLAALAEFTNRYRA